MSIEFFFIHIAPMQQIVFQWKKKKNCLRSTKKNTHTQDRSAIGELIKCNKYFYGLWIKRESTNKNKNFWPLQFVIVDKTWFYKMFIEKKILHDAMHDAWTTCMHACTHIMIQMEQKQWHRKHTQCEILNWTKERGYEIEWLKNVACSYAAELHWMTNKQARKNVMQPTFFSCWTCRLVFVLL